MRKGNCRINEAKNLVLCRLGAFDWGLEIKVNQSSKYSGKPRRQLHLSTIKARTSPTIFHLMLEVVLLTSRASASSLAFPPKQAAGFRPRAVNTLFRRPLSTSPSSADSRIISTASLHNSVFRSLGSRPFCIPHLAEIKLIMTAPNTGREENRLVISFDFGTTYSGVAYAFHVPGKKRDVQSIINWPGKLHLQYNFIEDTKHPFTALKT